MSRHALRFLGVATLWVALSGMTTIEIKRHAHMAELVYAARKLGADYETVMAMCRGNWVCTQVANDAYDRPTTSNYTKSEEQT